MLDRGKLARGLETILGNVAVEAPPSSVDSSNSNDKVLYIDPSVVQPNPHQPRKQFNPESIKALAKSIKEHGLLQPIMVKPGRDGRYQLIAGERRWRAAKELGLAAVPAIIREMSNKESLSAALVENLQREDLNPIEKAKAFWELTEVFGLTQEEVGRYTGLDRSTVANFLRLLELPIEVQEHVSRGTISPGHARALLALSDEVLQKKVCNRIIEEGLTVRQVEALTAVTKRPGSDSQNPVEDPKHPGESNHLQDLEDRLRKALRTKVQITQLNGKGKVVLYFHGKAQLEHLLGILGVKG